MFERTEALLDLFQVALRRIDQLADGLVIDRVSRPAVSSRASRHWPPASRHHPAQPRRQ